MKSKLIAGLKVTKRDIRKRSRWLNVPETFTMEKLPVNVEEVPARQKTKEW